MAKRPDVCTATGNLVAQMPPGPERDEILGLVRLAWKFTAQHVGRRPGPLTKEMLQIVRRPGALLTFEWLLDELEAAATRRSLYGDAESCIEQVNRVREIVIYHDPPAGFIQVTFKRVRNLLTACKKDLRA